MYEDFEGLCDKQERWSGQYRGIHFYISRQTPSRDRASRIWLCYYIHLLIDQLPPEADPESWWLEPQDTVHGSWKYYSYSRHPIMSDLDWHGGITYYKKESMDGSPRMITLGCDYNHIWDEGQQYTVNEIFSDVKATVDKLYELVPNLKVKCSWNGGLYHSKDGVFRNIHPWAQSFRSYESMKEEEK